MSSLKLPILLPSIWLFNISFTSPTAPPDRSERIYGAVYEYIAPALWPLLHRLSASIPCIAEAVVLLAAHVPSPRTSQLLARLAPSGDLPTAHANACFTCGAALAAISGLGRLWCFRALGRHFTHQLAMRHDHRLITTGPYALVRHPGYLFGILCGLGMSLVIASPGSFAWRCGWLGTATGRIILGVWTAQNVVGWALCYGRCLREDALLRERFREEWDAYAARVRYRMIPGVF